MTSKPGWAAPTGAPTPRSTASDHVSESTGDTRNTQLDELRRFTTAERWVHRTTSALMLTAIVTALLLYVPGFAELVGRRRLLVVVHEWSGILLPLPLAVGLFFKGMRADMRSLNRFGPQDRGWVWRAMRHGTGLAGPAGKFNAGQKLYAAVIAGLVVVMLGTGLMMWFTELSPLNLRTGASYVHDWLALAIGVLVLGHIRMALKDPEARHGMRTGWVARRWARREHPLWEQELKQEKNSEPGRPS
ncbi:formate dehydrogenase [Streptacidiphilus sp. 4-A2]|nr:formate dehydrogenase [Streptacidiphilus sp. 4-A2]